MCFKGTVTIRFPPVIQRTSVSEPYPSPPVGPAIPFKSHSIHHPPTPCPYSPLIYPPSIRYCRLFKSAGERSTSTFQEARNFAFQDDILSCKFTKLMSSGMSSLQSEGRSFTQNDYPTANTFVQLHFSYYVITGDTIKILNVQN